MDIFISFPILFRGNVFRRFNVENERSTFVVEIDGVAKIVNKKIVLSKTSN